MKCIAILCLLTLAWPAAAQPTTRPQPIPLQDILGIYRDGERQIEIRTFGTYIRVIDKRNWEGVYDPQTGKLDLWYFPRTSEMDPKAPQWAREAVSGRLKWTMSLTVARNADGKITFSGPRDFGKIQWHEDTDEFTKAVSARRAEALPEGDDARSVTLERQGPLIAKVSHIQFTRKIDDQFIRVDGPLGYDEPILIELYYDIDNDKQTDEVTLTWAGTRTQKIAVKRVPNEPRLMRSDPIYFAAPATRPSTQPATRPIR